MALETVVTIDQFATLRVIAEALLPAEPDFPIAHLAVLLKLDYIRAESEGYACTPSGLLRVARGH